MRTLDQAVPWSWIVSVGCKKKDYFSKKWPTFPSCYLYQGQGHGEIQETKWSKFEFSDTIIEVH